ncbi:T9SS type A sorting domain-containing protein [Aquimarina agarilytica]|uniref:T9SS type A sorting domain-containing protein n=1 Tax=Aquimarina agarilytica TaxID=1087449 RepID=UPI000287CFD5|nr:T9SS type A sorting domain-containing protein [Aquimarina agarilytica]
MKTKLLYLFTFITTLSFSQTNLVPNGNVESWTNSTTLDNWITENNVSQNTTDSTEGNSSASLLIIGNSSVNPKIVTKVPLTSGITYTVSYKFKYTTSSFTGSRSVCLKLVKDGSATTTTRCSTLNDNLWNFKEITFTPDQTGDYDLSISTSNFSGINTFEVLIDDIKVFDPLNLSVDYFKNDDQNQNIYPTITNGKIYFDKIENVDELNISVFNCIGQKENFVVNNNTIDLSRLATGIYFISLKTDKLNTVKRILKK